MFSCCTKSKLIHFRSHIFYFRWGKTPDVDKIYLLCTTTVFVSLSFKKFIMAAWLTLKILFSKFKKKSHEKFSFQTPSFFKKLANFSNWSLFWKLIDISKLAVFRVRKWYHTSDEYAVDPQHASPLTCPGLLWPRAPIPFGNKGSSGKNCGGNEIPGSFA